MVLKSVILVFAFGGVWPQAAEALNCYSCSGDECVNGVNLGSRVACNGLQDNCYTKFDGYVPIQRGCVSDLPAAEACSGSACETCNSDYCNVLSAASHKCVICSSVLDEKCISDPGSLQYVQCGAPNMNVLDAQCYSRVIGSVTERGCVQSQTDLDACDGTQCLTCTGQGCNNGEFPVERQKCAICSSQVCNTYAITSYCNIPDDSCVTARKNDGTYLKTCEQSMSDSDRQFCQSNPSACKFCTQYECNKNEINLQAPGRQCYTCQGTDCLQSSLEIGACHDIDDECFTFFDGYNPVHRGCRSTLIAQDKAICDDADDVGCALCTGDLCNLQGREDHFCAYCSSVVDGNCVAPTGQLTVVQCPAPTTEVTADAQCYTRILGAVTERGCLGSATDAERCDPTKNCETCAIEDGNACNTALFPADRRKCVVGTQADQYCPNPWDDCVQIASSSGGSNVKKCQSSMSAEEVSFCKANSNKCDFCAGDNCNQAEVTFDYLECLYCNSHDGSPCTTNPSSLTDFEYCRTCITLLTNTSQGQQILERGCLADLSPEDADQCVNHNNTNSNVTCATCSTNRCNNNNYPADRLACHTCSGGSCFSHESIKLEYCPNYRQEDSCFVQKDSTGVVLQMGCLSSLNTTAQTTCKAAPNLCEMCGSPGCNDPRKYANSGSCVQCDSALDVTCVGRAATMDAEPCNDPLNTQCYTRLVGGLTISRGCLSDLVSAEKDKCARGQNCTTCASPTGKCNVDIYPANRLACYQCLQPPCFSHDTITLEYCPSYRQGDSCFVQKNSTGVVLQMGCLSSLNATDHTNCKATPNLCERCNSPGCNDPRKYANSGSCVQCNSALDVTCVGRAATMDAEPCNDPLNSQCYTRLVGGLTTVRGCLSDLVSAEKDKCARGQNCTTCASPTGKCNVDIYPSDRLACYQCLQPPCFSHDTITLEYCPIYSTTDRCIMLTNTSGLPIRLGCNSTLSSAEQNTCRTNPQHCFYGSTLKSNDPNIILGSNKCVQCSSAYEPDCMGNATVFEALPCNDPLNTQCYSRFIDGKTTERGCLNSLDSSSKTQCLQGTNCAVCSSRIEKCNSNAYPMDQIKCYQCDSTKNAFCKNAQSGNGTHCPSYNSQNQCYIVVQQNGDTVRKCSTQPRSTECAGAERCEVCHFSQCNGRVSTAVMATTAGSRDTTTTTSTTARPTGGGANLGSMAPRTLSMVAMMIALAVARHSW